MVLYKEACSTRVDRRSTRATVSSVTALAPARFNTEAQALPVAPVVITPTIYYSYINQLQQAAASGALSPIGPTSGYGKQALERAHQFNLTIQRDIGFNTVVDVGYVGNFDWFRLVPGTAATKQPRRIRPYHLRGR